VALVWDGIVGHVDNRGDLDQASCLERLTPRFGQESNSVACTASQSPRVSPFTEISMPPVFERPFTLLVGGRPILSFVASTFTEANELTREEWLRADLLKYRSNDEPLWDGTAKLSVRVSDAEEKAALELGLKATRADDGIALVYLVELDNA
jgi:hypothetical protein